MNAINGREPAMPYRVSNDVMIGGDHPNTRIFRIFEHSTSLEIRLAFHPRSDLVSTELGECLADKRILIFTHDDMAMIVKPNSEWRQLAYSEFDYIVLAQVAACHFDDRSAIEGLGHILSVPEHFYGLKFSLPNRPIIQGTGFEAYLREIPDTVVKWGRV